MKNRSHKESGRNRIIWINDAFTETSNALVPMESKGVMYGAGCFETLRADKGRLLHLQRHLNRLKEGIDYLGGNPDSIGGVEIFRKRIGQLIAQNRLEKSEALIRIQASIRGGRGYSVPEEQEMDLMISADPLVKKKDSIVLHTVQTRVVSSRCRPSHLKLSNSLHYMKAWQEAKRAGADDALMLTTEDDVAETAIANLFWKTGDIISTPSPDCDILPGVMRKIIIELLLESDLWQVEEGRFSLDELKNAESAWITNSVREMVPVRQLDDAAYRTDISFYREITRLFQTYKQNHWV